MNNKRGWVWALIGILLIAAVYFIASAFPVPYRIVTEYPMGMIFEEAIEMHDCAECHETEDFHTCTTCHNEHGSAVFAGLNLYSTIHLTGDVPESKFIPTNQIFLDNAEEIGQITIHEFLKQNGVDSFTSITFASNDGGFTTIQNDQLGDTSFLLPYENGVRFADENIHVSTWIKGITKIIVVGERKDLIIGDMSYSLGELMLKDTVRFTVEQAQVMLKSEQDGVIRKGFTAERLEGIDLGKVLELITSKSYHIADQSGNIIELPYDELINAKLILIGKEITLVFPYKSRNQWITGLTEITEVIE
jgi:hypothetical protein